MLVLFRAATYASLFIGFFLVFVPARVLSWFGAARPQGIGVSQVVGMTMAAFGIALALACILTFAFVGRGTPAPFDPPRRLVERGPYRFVRNPMYVGATLTLAGAAAVYESWALLGYAGLFIVVSHVLVIRFEEPTLRRMFGADYESYCRRIPRWWPR